MVKDDPSAGYQLSPDGKLVAQLDVRELDHRLVLNVFSVADKKLAYQNIDARASSPIAFSPDGKKIVYTVRENGVDNLWEQPLEGSSLQAADALYCRSGLRALRFRRTGRRLRSNGRITESDAVLLRDTEK